MPKKRNKGGGRKPLPEEQKTVVASVRLPRPLADRLQREKSKSAAITAALRKHYNFKDEDGNE